MTATRVVIAQQVTENRLRAVLEAYHRAPLHLFSTLDRDIALDFVTDYPTPEQASASASAAAEDGRRVLVRARPGGAKRGHRSLLEGNDVAVVADDAPGASGCAVVDRDGGAPGGDDAQDPGAEPMPDLDLRAAQPGGTEEELPRKATSACGRPRWERRSWPSGPAPRSSASCHRTGRR